jgi:hypothetical protein
MQFMLFLSAVGKNNFFMHCVFYNNSKKIHIKKYMAKFRQIGDAFYFFSMQVIVNIGKQLIIRTVWLSAEKKVRGLIRLIVADNLVLLLLMQIIWHQLF